MGLLKSIGRVLFGGSTDIVDCYDYIEERKDDLDDYRHEDYCQSCHDSYYGNDGCYDNDDDDDDDYDDYDDDYDD